MTPFRQLENSSPPPVAPRSDLSSDMARYSVGGNSTDSVSLSSGAITLLETLPRMQLPPPIALRPYRPQPLPDQML